MKHLVSFDDAFKILDQASSAQPEPALGELFSHELQIFKVAVSDETAASFAQISRGSAQLAEAAGTGVRLIDQHMRENPMLYLGAVVAGAFAIGLLASTSDRRRLALKGQV